MKRVAVISAILEEPQKNQNEFNRVVANYKHLIKGRMGLPLTEEEVTIICITVVGEINDINSLTGKLGKISNIQVKTSISKREF
ncbi:MAG: iron-only hydrogenase system regulator [Vallitalea sp.]|nr:iron-only hydrogenase system regulator [Vallitalea sp.]